MSISKEILEFYDLMLDGEGMGKMIRAGGRIGIPPERIRAAAKMVYDQFISGAISISPLTAAKKVYKTAKKDVTTMMHYAEIKAAMSTEELLKRIEELEAIVEKKSMSWWQKILYWSCYW